VASFVDDIREKIQIAFPYTLAPIDRARGSAPTLGRATPLPPPVRSAASLRRCDQPVSAPPWPLRRD